MTDVLGAGPESGRQSGAATAPGTYSRSLVMRIGKSDLLVPGDRNRRCSTDLFARYQRSENALVSALTHVYVRGYRPAR